MLAVFQTPKSRGQGPVLGLGLSAIPDALAVDAHHLHPFSVAFLFGHRY